MRSFDKIKVFEDNGKKKGKGIYIIDGVEKEFLEYIINPDKAGRLPANGMHPGEHFKETIFTANVYPAGYQGKILSRPRYLEYIGG